MENCWLNCRLELIIDFNKVEILGEFWWKRRPKEKTIVEWREETQNSSIIDPKTLWIEAITRFFAVTKNMEQLSINLIIWYSKIFIKDIYFGSLKNKKSKASNKIEISWGPNQCSRNRYCSFKIQVSSWRMWL